MAPQHARHSAAAQHATASRKCQPTSLVAGRTTMLYTVAGLVNLTCCSSSSGHFGASVSLGPCSCPCPFPPPRVSRGDMPATSALLARRESCTQDKGSHRQITCSSQLSRQGKRVAKRNASDVSPYVRSRQTPLRRQDTCYVPPKYSRAHGERHKPVCVMAMTLHLLVLWPFCACGVAGVVYVCSVGPRDKTDAKRER